MSIGEVLAQLRPEFPAVTISKLRFLEDQGLVEPQRAPSGYRKYSYADVERLRYVLGVQRDHYLPLRVIRQHLASMDGGAPSSNPNAPGAALAAGGGPRALVAAPAPGERAPLVQVDRAQLVDLVGGDEALVTALESFGLVAVHPAQGGYDADSVAVARIARALADYGIEPRHLRAFRTVADREAGLVEQVVAPLRRQRGEDAADRAEEVAREVAGLTVRLHAALLRAALDQVGAGGR
jgi:DNA-binding transcriptional MerR regulator